jgi:peptide/nickel transport system substrate-binding protein
MARNLRAFAAAGVLLATISGAAPVLAQKSGGVLKIYKIGLNLTGVGVDDPDAQFFENYACGSQRNYTGYCNPELQNLFEQQSMETDQEKRKRLVWEIDRRLQEDQARPIVYHLRFATCWQPRVKGLRMMVNSVFNGWRFEDVWLDD